MTNSIKDVLTAYGWQCPICGSVMSPTMQTCIIGHSAKGSATTEELERKYNKLSLSMQASIDGLDRKVRMNNERIAAIEEIANRSLVSSDIQEFPRPKLPDEVIDYAKSLDRIRDVEGKNARLNELHRSQPDIPIDSNRCYCDICKRHRSYEVSKSEEVGTDLKLCQCDTCIHHRSMVKPTTLDTCKCNPCSNERSLKSLANKTVKPESSKSKFRDILNDAILPDYRAYSDELTNEILSKESPTNDVNSNPNPSNECHCSGCNLHRDIISNALVESSDPKRKTVVTCSCDLCSLHRGRPYSNDTSVVRTYERCYCATCNSHRGITLCTCGSCKYHRDRSLTDFLGCQSPISESRFFQKESVDIPGHTETCMCDICSLIRRPEKGIF